MIRAALSGQQLANRLVSAAAAAGFGSQPGFRVPIAAIQSDAAEVFDPTAVRVDPEPPERAWYSSPAMFVRVVSLSSS